VVTGSIVLVFEALAAWKPFVSTVCSPRVRIAMEERSGFM